MYKMVIFLILIFLLHVLAGILPKRESFHLVILKYKSYRKDKINVSFLTFIYQFKIIGWHGRGNRKLVFNGYGVSVREVGKVLEMVVMVVQQCECTKCHWTIHLKMFRIVNFMLCVFYYSKILKIGWFPCIFQRWLSLFVFVGFVFSIIKNSWILA